MNDKEIIKYVRRIIIDNLFYYECIGDVAMLLNDDTNKMLLEHVKGLKALFGKAESILKGSDKE